MTPVRRTYLWLHNLGLEPEPCSWYSRWPGMAHGKQHDLCGCFDCLAFLPPGYAIDIWHGPGEPRDFWGKIGPQIVGPCIVGIQITDGSSHSKRRDKIKASKAAARFASAGGRIVVFSWGLRGARGKRKTWSPRIEEICP